MDALSVYSMVEDLLGQETTRSPRPTSFGLLEPCFSPFSLLPMKKLEFSSKVASMPAREERQNAFCFYLSQVGSLRFRGGMD